ncbi:unnamed protein product [marine sediment metagenome]|uniref:Uncharacterized protein n=1 Tax=marine sediment metagenome TaxID=412755 RepID=X1B259_9ZZZZ
MITFFAAGELKGKWLNVGAVMEGDNGKFIFINRTFNPAGVPNPDGRDNIIVSMFTPKSKQVENTEPEKAAPVSDDEVPF